MRHLGNRQIKVAKNDLIKKVKENKKEHVVEYKRAVIDYKIEALKQLEQLTEEVNDGSLIIQLSLITPIDNSENYDKIVQMFEWEVEDEVVLTQQEFNEYIFDETDFARSAKFSNTAYSIGN